MGTKSSQEINHYCTNPLATLASLSQHWDHVGTYEMWKAFGRRSLFRSDCDTPSDTFDIITEQREGWGYASTV